MNESKNVRHGPDPGLVAAVSFVLTLASVVVPALMSGGASFLSPFASTAEVAGRIGAHHDAVRVAAFFQIGAAVPLGVAAATFYARLRQHTSRVPGPVIGLTGGLVAVTSLITSGSATYVESRPEVIGSPELVHAFAFLAFATGGVGYVVGLGLLLAGVAVPSLFLRLLPRWLAATGLVLAVLAELSWLSLLVEPLQLLLPVGRFAGGLWLVVAGLRLARRGAR